MADYYVNSYNKDGKGNYLKELVCTEAPTSILNELELKLKGLDLKWVRAVESSQESVGDDSHKERLSLICHQARPFLINVEKILFHH